MSLIIANILGFITLHWKQMLYALGGLILLGGVLFGIQKCGDWRAGRKIDKLKANISIATKELANVQANIDADKIDEAKKLEDVKLATNSYIDATSATDAGKKELKQALQNVNSAVAANRPIGTTASDLNRRIAELDNQ